MDNLYIKKNKLGDKTLIIILSSALGVVLVAAIVLAILLINNGDGKDKNPNGTPALSATPVATEEPVKKPIVEDATTLGERFNPPEGYVKVDVDSGSYAEFIRNYTLKPFNSVAYYYDDKTGSYLENKEASKLGVFQLPTALNRWMQCADSVIMLYAEHLYAEKKYSEISFTFANGFVCDWMSYMQGNRFNMKTNKWELKAEPSDTYETFQKYLDLVYQFANTDSLARDMSSSPAMDDIQIGDAFVVGVSQLQAVASAINPDLDIKYGHAIFVVDVAVNKETGKKIFMLAEGNTPATEIAVIENPNTDMGVWFEFNEVGQFVKSSESGLPWSAAWLKRFPGQK